MVGIFAAPSADHPVLARIVNSRLFSSGGLGVSFACPCRMDVPMRFLLAGLAASALICAASNALACGPEIPPSAPWTLDHLQFAGDIGLPFLSPGNDSRINLQMLMMDSKPWPVNAAVEDASNQLLNNEILFARSDFDAAFGAPAPAAGSQNFADGEGSRCRSLDSGAQAFAEAVKAAADLSEAERTTLTAARTKMVSGCDGQGERVVDVLAGLPAPSAEAKEFAAYLAGARLFYDGTFDLSADAFKGLRDAKNPWVKETARYMIGRVALNKAQVGAFDAFDQTGQPKISDKEALMAAEAAFNAYLADYPAGRYAASARGLMRRLYWLSGDKTRLAAEYGKTILAGAGPASSIPSGSLAEEIDQKLLRADATPSHDPNLLAVANLMRLRADKKQRPAFPAAELEAQAADFAGHDALFGYLRAARAYYADGDAAAALKMLGPTEDDASWLGFSREILRGQALMALGDYSAAIDHWRKLLPRAEKPFRKEAVELGLALSFERAKTLNKVFMPDTRISSPRIRAQVLAYAAGPILLRQAVADPLSTPEERRLARFILLYKEATRGQYANFLKDFDPQAIARDEVDAPKLTFANASAFNWEGDKAGYACPAFKQTMSLLAREPQNPRGLLCLAEMTRAQSLDSVESGVPGADELGGANPIFPGEIFARGDIYKKLIAQPRTPAAERAYALYRAVNCYAPSGKNDCGGKDVDKAQRKAWYDELKGRYGSTEWAQKLRFYW